MKKEIKEVTKKIVSHEFLWDIASVYALATQFVQKAHLVAGGYAIFFFLVSVIEAVMEGEA